MGYFPFIPIVFVIAVVIFGMVLHKTVFGRSVCGMENDSLACRYSCVKTDRILVTVYLLIGMMSAICAILLTFRMGSTRPMWR
jgi:rhamnose transport system permease protein